MVLMIVSGRSDVQVQVNLSPCVRWKIWVFTAWITFP